MNSLFKRKIALSLLALSFAGSAVADEPPIKVGFMLPYTGTYAALGNAITNGFKQYVLSLIHI